MSVNEAAFGRKAWRYVNDPLYKNSVFILTGRTVSAFTGFFFWLVAARLYAIEDVGVASTLISSASLIVFMSTLGFDQSLVRFMSRYEKGRVIGTCVTVTVSVGLALATGYVFLAAYGMSIIGDFSTGAVFIGLTVTTALAVALDTSFVAMRTASLSLAQNIVLASRLVFLVPMAFLGALGIMTSNILACCVACAVSGWLLVRMIGPRFAVDKGFIGESLSYSFGNYAASIIVTAPFFFLPLLILGWLGDAEAARYYIAYTLGNFLLQVVDAIGLALFVEGSHGESLRKGLARSGAAAYAVAVPAIVIIFIAGDNVLGLFGTGYEAAFDLFKLMAISSVFYIAFTLFVQTQKVRMRLKSVIGLNLLASCVIVILSVLLIPYTGITGVGYAMVIAYAAAGSVAVFIALKEKAL